MRLLALVLLAACGSARPTSGPAWPKAAAKETDGGESLAPRAKAASVAAIEEDSDEEVAPTTTTDKPAEKAATPEGVKATTPEAATPPEITITTEEIVIEIDD